MGRGATELELGRTSTRLEVESPSESGLFLGGCGLGLIGMTLPSLLAAVDGPPLLAALPGLAMLGMLVLGALYLLLDVHLELDNPRRRILLVRRFAYIFEGRTPLAHFDDVAVVTGRAPIRQANREILLALRDGRVLGLPADTKDHEDHRARVLSLARHLGAEAVPPEPACIPRIDRAGGDLVVRQVSAESPGPTKTKDSLLVDGGAFFEAYVGTRDERPDAKPPTPYEETMRSELALEDIGFGIGCAPILGLPGLVWALPRAIEAVSAGSPLAAALWTAAAWFTGGVGVGVAAIPVVRAYELFVGRPRRYPRGQDPSFELGTSAAAGATVACLLAAPLLHAAGALGVTWTPLVLAGILATVSAAGGLVEVVQRRSGLHRLPGGRRAAPALPPPRLEVLAQDLATQGAACPYCGDRLEASTTVACRRCEAMLHAECWQEAGACTTYGCGETGASPLADP